MTTIEEDIRRLKQLLRDGRRHDAEQHLQKMIVKVRRTGENDESCRDTARRLHGMMGWLKSVLQDGNMRKARSIVESWHEKVKQSGGGGASGFNYSGSNGGGFEEGRDQEELRRRIEFLEDEVERLQRDLSELEKDYYE